MKITIVSAGFVSNVKVDVKNLNTLKKNICLKLKKYLSRFTSLAKASCLKTSFKKICVGLRHLATLTWLTTVFNEHQCISANV